MDPKNIKVNKNNDLKVQRELMTEEVIDDDRDETFSESKGEPGQLEYFTE